MPLAETLALDCKMEGDTCDTSFITIYFILFLLFFYI